MDRYGDKFDKKSYPYYFQYSPSDSGLAFLAAVQKVLQTDGYEPEGGIAGVKEQLRRIKLINL